MSLREHSIYDCIINNALNYSDEIALVSGDLRLTYREIPLHVNSLSRGLLNMGLEKGDRIGVLLIIVQNMHYFWLPVLELD